MSTSAAAVSEAETELDDLDIDVDLAPEDAVGVPPALQRQLLDQQLGAWRNTRYSVKWQYQVHKLLEEKDQMDLCRKELLRCQKAIGLLEKAQRDLEPVAS